MKILKTVFLLLISLAFASGCTKLDETVGGNLTSGQITNSVTAELLLGVYGSLEYTFTGYEEIFGLSDITTDEAIVPTRGIQLGR